MTGEKAEWKSARDFLIFPDSEITGTLVVLTKKHRKYGANIIIILKSTTNDPQKFGDIFPSQVFVIKNIFSKLSRIKGTYL